MISENRERIFRICGYYFQRENDRDDAYQDILIRIWEHLSSFREKSQISTWIFRIAVNTCLMYIRKNKSRQKIFSRTVTTAYSNMPDEVPYSEDTGQETKLAFFREFMQEISPVDRSLVSLYLEDFTTKEMAELTGISEANVRVRIHRIKERIKDKWKEKQHGTG